MERERERESNRECLVTPVTALQLSVLQTGIICKRKENKEEKKIVLLPPLVLSYLSISSSLRGKKIRDKRQRKGEMALEGRKPDSFESGGLG